MVKQSRRDFLKTTAAIGAATSVIPFQKTKAAPKNVLSEDRKGVLVDFTLCIGCRKCEWACRSAHDIPAGNIEDYDDKTVFDEFRRMDKDDLTVVNKFTDEEKGDIFAKVNCRHCDEPACVSACIVGAIEKHENGSVVWNSDKCIGCRYCMVACPFQVPAFEYHKAIQPDIKKCDFCFDRTQEGKLPACVEICPMEVMTYGKRYELIDLAHKRIDDNPDKYVDHVFGEHEVGGTSWLYIADRKFSEFRFPELNNDPAPGVSEKIQHGIFAYFIPPILFYALLGGIMWITKNRNKSE
jgi:Fe-S-cluster-containing dehydrogenase component